MTDEMKEQEGKKKSGRNIGSITDMNPFATLGSKHSSVQQSERSNVQTSTSSDFQTSRSPEVETVGSSNVKRSKHPEWKQKTIYLPPALARWLNVYAAQTDVEISEIVMLALQEYRERHNGISS
jgi:hypothetical protein